MQRSREVVNTVVLIYILIILTR